MSKLSSYITGFVLSIVLTVVAYILVVEHVSSGHTTFTHTFLIATVVVLAIAQLFVQVYFFLHLGREHRPRWNTIFFLLTALITAVVVGGSLWIMYHLNHNMMMLDTKYPGGEVSPQNQKD